MLFIVGWSNRRIVIGAVRAAPCRQCGSSGPATLVATERRLSLFFLPVSRRRAGWTTICAACGAATDVDRDAARSLEAGAEPIETGRLPGPMPAPAAAAGWYSDPGGDHELRFWDGAAWTDWVSNRGVAAQAHLRSPQP